MIRNRLSVIIALTVLATPALAADTTAFTLQCQAKGGPASACICMASELEKTADGQVVLDGWGITDLPEADRAPARAALMARYKLTPDEMTRIGNAMPAMLDKAHNICEPE